MDISVNKFGTILTSRKDGKEAYLAIQSSLKDGASDEDITIDFNGVLSLSPSWGDEFVTPLKEDYKDRLKLKNISNASVLETLKLLSKIHSLDFGDLS